MNDIAKIIEEMSKAEDERLSLEKKKIEDLNGEILEKFVSVQNNRNSNRQKSEEWRIFNENFIKENAYYLKKLTLKIDANHLKKETGSSKIVCQEGWNFDYRVSLTGEFESASFTEVTFREYCWIGAVFNEFARFHNITFLDSVIFHETIFDDWVSFRKVIFNEGAVFSEVEFNGESYFEIESKPKSKECISLCQNSQDQINHKKVKEKSITFEGSEFARKTNFELRNLDIYNFSFAGCKFKSDMLFRYENSTIHSLDLSNSIFGVVTKFIPYSHNRHKKPIYEIKVNYSIFRETAIFEIDFAECPDFSKCYFIERFFIKETWSKISDKQIGAWEREKFLFLKGYFSNMKNHFKENLYFSYEMRAREKVLEREMYCKYSGKYLRRLVYLIAMMSNKKIRKFFVYRYSFFSKEFCELFLFKLYKWMANYGLSIKRPFISVIFSYLYFGYYFDMSLVKDPYENSLIRTLNPLYDVSRGYGGDLDNFQVAASVQSLTNTVLLFLLFLGIRNRFKIKS